MSIKLLTSPYVVSLTLLLIANVCFYDMGTIRLYQILTIFAVLVIFGKALIENNLVVFLQHNCVKYLLALYTIYTIYGLFFLRAGDYNDDMLIFTCIQNIAIYICMINFLKRDNWIDYYFWPFLMSAAFIIFYILSFQSSIIFSAQLDERIGDGLSGNVNTVGYSLGTISMVLVFYLIKTKKILVLLILIPDWTLMLLTGSKKTILIMVVELFMFYYYTNNKRRSFWWILILSCIFYYVLFNIPVFYELIGERIEDMIGTMLGLSKANYSHSTDVREGMINEGFRLWLQVPIFGGGMNYFATATQLGYDYSHCNVTELLCNFGLFGTLLYYIPYFKNLKICFKELKKDKDRYIFAGSWLICALILSWCMVQFSDICIAYIPIVTSFALLESRKYKNRYTYVKN